MSGHAGDMTDPRAVRFRSIDQVRGAVMVFMALDHVRFFFTDLTFQPENLAETNLGLFLTRWITHYCAPGFFLLAGTGIFLFAAKMRDPAKVTRYLVTRGLLLIVLELTIVGYSWVFRPGYSFAGVIWAFGWCFLLMAALVRLPQIVLSSLAGAVLLFHNLLDAVTLEGSGWGLVLWRFLYHAGPADIPGIVEDYYFLYSVIPWLAIMVLGYVLGSWFLRPAEARSRAFVAFGATCLVIFVGLRLTNLYGNPATLFISETTSGLFALQPDLAKTVINFLNTEKYPPSLQFSLMTLGPIFLWLGASKVDDPGARVGSASETLILFGRVPLFFYVLHLYLIHLLALALGFVTSEPIAWLLPGRTASPSRTEGFGFDLWVIYVMWAVVVAILYIVCRWYMDYKRRHDYAWLKYL